eukprot:6173342-Pleurochrysis_carterae.AAC.1
MRSLTIHDAFDSWAASASLQEHGLDEPGVERVKVLDTGDVQFPEAHDVLLGVRPTRGMRAPVRLLGRRTSGRAALRATRASWSSSYFLRCAAWRTLVEF